MDDDNFFKNFSFSSQQLRLTNCLCGLRHPILLRWRMRLQLPSHLQCPAQVAAGGPAPCCFPRLPLTGAQRGEEQNEPNKSHVASLAWSNIPLKSQCDALLPSLLMHLCSRSSLEGSMNQVGEQGFGRQNIGATFPEGWMSSGQILRGGTFQRPL